MKYWIVWNAAKNDGVITDEKEQAEAAYLGDRGRVDIATLLDFMDRYDDEYLVLQEVTL